MKKHMCNFDKHKGCHCNLILFFSYTYNKIQQRQRVKIFPPVYHHYICGDGTKFGSASAEHNRLHIPKERASSRSPFHSSLMESVSLTHHDCKSIGMIINDNSYRLLFSVVAIYSL